MKTFSRNIMLFIFLCLSIEAQEKWMLLDKQPEIYFNFYDSDEQTMLYTLFTI